MKSLLLALLVVVASLCAVQPSAQAGPVGRVVTAPVRGAKALFKAQPVRRVVRCVFGCG